jgi:hypothetical protein
VVRPAYHRFRHTQEFVESDGAFRNGVTSTAVDKELRVMVKDIDDEKRLLRSSARPRAYEFRNLRSMPEKSPPRHPRGGTAG